MGIQVSPCEIGCRPYRGRPSRCGDICRHLCGADVDEGGLQGRIIRRRFLMMRQSITYLARVLTVIGVLVWFAELGRADEPSITCAICHAPQAGELAQSIHAKLGCQECHGGKAMYDLSAGQLKQYNVDQSIARGGHDVLAGQARAGAAPFDHGSSFKGKPSRKEIPVFCGTCHADVERMNPYGLHTDQLGRYLTSVHGKTLTEKGDDRVAVCTDCHGSHGVLQAKQPNSKTHPLNVPDTCGACHADKELMADFGHSADVVDEYRHSVHGRLLLEQRDTGAPTCATCHGNHAAAPRGVSAVGAVCGQCHSHVEANYLASIHASQGEFRGCIQCHGGGEGSHLHNIQRITVPASRLVDLYDKLLASNQNPTPEEIAEAIHPQPRRIVEETLSSCMECHDEPDEDESLPRLLEAMDVIAASERQFVVTAHRLDEISRGVLLVEDQQFKLEEAKTNLIELASLQHRLDPKAVQEEAAKLDKICSEVNIALDKLERGLHWRYKALFPIWAFALLFSAVLYAKYRSLKAQYVEHGSGGSSRGKHP